MESALWLRTSLLHQLETLPDDLADAKASIANNLGSGEKFVADLAALSWLLVDDVEYFESPSLWTDEVPHGRFVSFLMCLPQSWDEDANLSYSQEHFVLKLLKCLCNRSFPWALFCMLSKSLRAEVKDLVRTAPCTLHLFSHLLDNPVRLVSSLHGTGLDLSPLPAAENGLTIAAASSTVESWLDGDMLSLQERDDLRKVTFAAWPPTVQVYLDQYNLNGRYNIGVLGSQSASESSENVISLSDASLDELWRRVNATSCLRVD